MSEQATESAVAAPVTESPAAAEVLPAESPSVETPPVNTESASSAQPTLDELALASQESYRGDGKKSVRQDVASRLKARAEEAERTHHSHEQPRDDAGRFEGEQEASAADPVATGSEDSAQADTFADSTVTIEIDESNPLYAQGVRTLDGVPPHLERHIRTLANGASRRREVEESRTALTAVQEENVRLKARLEALSKPADDSPLNDPKTQDYLRQIREVDPERAEIFEAGLRRQDDERVRAAEDAAVQSAQFEMQAQQFMVDIAQQAPSKYPMWLKNGELAQRMQVAATQYAEYVDTRNLTLQNQGRSPMAASTQEFFSWVDGHYVKDPRVAEHLQGVHKERMQQEAQKAVQAERAKFAEQEKAKLKETAQRHASRPPSPPAVKSQGRAEDTQRVDPAQSHGTRQRAIRGDLRERLKDAYSGRQ